MSSLSMASHAQPSESAAGRPPRMNFAYRRRFLDISNALHDTGVQNDVDLPIIAVVGSQSSGKSSLIESMAHVSLPRATRTCTRVPIECRLSRSSGKWQCTVTLVFTFGNTGEALGRPRIVNFGPDIDGNRRHEVTERIRRAQCAILNPDKDYRDFIEKPLADSYPGQLSFSKNYVRLKINGPNVHDLAFYDLPGLIARTANNQTSDGRLVEELIESYIAKPTCIILLTVACETDFDNQAAYQLAQQYDPDGERTIGVLTMPDRIRPQDEWWMRLIRNEENPLRYGWFSVFNQNEDPTTRNFSYLKNAPWNKLEGEHRKRLGIDNVEKQLDDVLSAQIEQCLPTLEKKFREQLDATNAQLQELPKEPSSDPLSEVLFHLTNFSQNLSRCVEGTADKDGLQQSTRPDILEFCKSIRSTEPLFLPYRSDSTPALNNFNYQAPSFLAVEDGPEEYSPKDFDGAIYIDQVANRRQTARSRELPDRYPFEVEKEYITSFTSKWERPAINLFRMHERVLKAKVDKLIVQDFGLRPSLESRVKSAVDDFWPQFTQRALESLRLFIDLESRPRAPNEKYYNVYKRNLYDHYEQWRLLADQPLAPVIAQLLSGALSGSQPPDVREIISEAITSGLSVMGIGETQSDDLAVFFPSQRDPDIHIMASVRAYFQIAYRRFTDNLPNIIDYELVLGLVRNQTLEQALRKGLGIEGEGAYSRCKEFMSEPRRIAERREELKAKCERLEKAIRTLVEIPRNSPGNERVSPTPDETEMDDGELQAPTQRRWGKLDVNIGSLRPLITQCLVSFGLSSVLYWLSVFWGRS